MSSPFQFNSDHTKLHICGPRLLPLQSLWECFFFLIYHSCCKEGCSISHVSPAPSTMPYLPDHTFLRMKHPHHNNLQQGVWNSSCILISKWWNASSGVTSRQCYNTKTGDCTSWGRELLPAVCCCDSWLAFSYKQHAWPSDMLFENMSYMFYFTAHSECFSFSPGTRQIWKSNTCLLTFK